MRDADWWIWDYGFRIGRGLVLAVVTFILVGYQTYLAGGHRWGLALIAFLLALTTRTVSLGGVMIGVLLLGALVPRELLVGIAKVLQ